MSKYVVTGFWQMNKQSGTVTPTTPNICMFFYPAAKFSRLQGPKKPEIWQSGTSATTWEELKYSASCFSTANRCYSHWTHTHTYCLRSRVKTKGTYLSMTMTCTSHLMQEKTWGSHFYILQCRFEPRLHIGTELFKLTKCTTVSSGRLIEDGNVIMIAHIIIDMRPFVYGLQPLI